MPSPKPWRRRRRRPGPEAALSKLLSRSRWGWWVLRVLSWFCLLMSLSFFFFQSSRAGLKRSRGSSKGEGRECQRSAAPLLTRAAVPKGTRQEAAVCVCTHLPSSSAAPEGGVPRCHRCENPASSGTRALESGLVEIYDESDGLSLASGEV